MDLRRILQLALYRGASDVHLKVGLPPILRVAGKLTPVKGEKRLSPRDTLQLALSIMN